MRTRTKVLTGFVALVIVFGLLRIYGAYQNERKTALFIAAQASEAGRAAEQEVAEDKAHSACVKAWLQYDNEEAKANLVRITAGESAYAKEEARIFGDKPLCSRPDTSFDGAFRDLDSSLGHIDTQYGNFYVAALENRYASDRVLQTRHVLHQAWAKVIGAPLETQEEWGKFLAKSYPDIEMKNCSTPTCQTSQSPERK
jgi:hypothetical protein